MEYMHTAVKVKNKERKQILTKKKLLIMSLLGIEP